MGKGQIGKIILVLVILGVVIYFLWPYLQTLIPSGDEVQNGVEPPPPKYKNDIITVEDIYISNLKPYSDSITIMELLIKNNGDMKVSDIEVNFFDTSGFTVEEINCEGENKTDHVDRCNQNDFGSIDPLDTRTISLRLKAPSVTSETPLTISYSIKYSYSGYRKADIPIIDGITRKEPITEFSQSTPTYGPIVLKMEPPVGRERKEDSKIIKEYWIAGNIPFEMEFSLKHVGSSSIGMIKQPINISKGKIALNISDLVVDAPCYDFKVGVNSDLISTKSVLVPGKLICYFKPAKVPDPEVSATIMAGFDYTYEYIKTETFTIQPLPED